MNGKEYISLVLMFVEVLMEGGEGVQAVEGAIDA